MTPWDFHDSESMRPSLKLRDYSVGVNRGRTKILLAQVPKVQDEEINGRKLARGLAMRSFGYYVPSTIKTVQICTDIKLNLAFIQS